jgi:polyphosphate kinase
VVDLLEQASTNPSVLAIKQILYRVNRDSPIVEALITAAENGKQVTALVELKARFDEEVNVEWAHALEEAGVHVVYGLVGLKTHCKVTLVVRREPGGVRRYVHLGTGNYNEQTATIYSDLSYFTMREDVCSDISALFNLLTGYSEPPSWKKLVVAPLGLRRQLLDLIDRERSIAKKGGEATIIFKSNALIDPHIIRALCKASQSGVRVHLLIRGPSSIRVGIPGLSDKLSVRFIVDRFLEHSRIFYFTHEGVEDVYLTSTDIMPRNFDRRVEVMLPIEDERLKRRIVDEILAIELADNTKATELQPDGTFARPKPKAEKVRAQAELIARARKRAGTGKKKKKKDKKNRRSTVD